LSARGGPVARRIADVAKGLATGVHAGT